MLRSPVVSDDHTIWTGFFASMWNCIPDYLDRCRKRRALRKLLSDPKWEFRNFERLQQAIGETAENTVSLLLSIGARRSEREHNVWTLKK
jgi:hypothetical protein